jgi:glycosyltransferase involved in cell wall biosynthesis
VSRTGVLFFTNRLGGGGAEMQALRMANALDPAEFDVHVAVCRAGGEYERLLLPTVTLHHLAPDRVRSSTLGLLAAAIPLRRLVEKQRPAIVCSFMDAANAIAALAVKRHAHRPRMVACVQNPLSQELVDPKHPVKRAVFAVVRRTYPRADAIVALTRGVGRDLAHHIPAAGSRVTVIHNAGLDARLAERAKEPIDADLGPIPRPLVVACGRLAPQKDYPHLLDAFASVQRETGAHLWILGDGPDRQALEDQVARLRLSSVVRFLGFRKNPYAFMAKADVFVLSSIYEGFGNVLVEAMAAGAPVVATDCPHGPGEIITDGESGLLVPVADPPRMAEALRRVLQDRVLANRLAQNGQRRAQDFHVDKIGAEYAALFRRLA